MLFFRNIYLVAALAFATLTSAAPLEGAGLVSGEVLARDVSEVSLPVKRGGSLYDAYNTCHEHVSGIIVEINAAVKINDHAKVLSCLNDIVAEIQIVIDVLNGGVVDVGVSVDVFASLVCGLIQIIAQISIVVIGLDVQIRACIGIIGNLLGSLLHLTLGVVVDLEVVLVVLLKPLGGLLGSLGFLDIFVGIGLNISL